MVLEFELPWPPSLNHYKKVGIVRTTKAGKLYQARYNSDDTKFYYHAVWIKVFDQLKHKDTQPFKGLRMKAELVFHPPHKRKYDLDNRLKVMFDAMQKANLYYDDEQIDVIIIRRGEKIENGLVKVRLESI